MTNFSSSQELEENLLTTKNSADKARLEWDFRLTTVVSSTSAVGAAIPDVLGALVFDPSDNLLATGGIARKIRVYNVNSLLFEGEGSNDAVLLDHAVASDFCICTPAKLSSLKWKPGSDSRVIGSGDYDGVVMEYDLERRVPVFERDEHAGRRVWSMDYSHWDPIVGGSGSDDGSMQMWDPRCDDGKCLSTVHPSQSRSPVCCVEFNPFGSSLVTAGCADRKLYGYDVRMMVDPLFILEGHHNAITYAKFLDHRTIVTSGIDGTLRMWDTDDHSLIQTYKGHINSKRFVGLSVWRSGGLLCCGSENNQVFVYDKRWGEPIWVYGCDTISRVRLSDEFVSSVGWMQGRDDRCTFVTGGSDGVLRVFNGKRIEVIN